MKIKSRVDIFHNIFFYSTVLLLLCIIIFLWFDINEQTSVKIWISIVFFAVIAFMLSIRFRTYYCIDNEFLHFVTGPIKGKIKIKSIKTLEVGKTMWLGTMKPATALKGIIVKYNKYDEIYISPSDNLQFAEELQKINPDITVNFN